MRIGFHFPFAGGLIHLKERIRRSRGSAYQVFTRGIRGGDLKELHKGRLERFLDFQEERKLMPVIHAPYTYNLANLMNEDEKKVLEDLEYIKQFKSAYYVMNPGRSVDLEPISALRSEEHTSELQSRGHLVCRLLLEK